MSDVTNETAAVETAVNEGAAIGGTVLAGVVPEVAPFVPVVTKALPVLEELANVSEAAYAHGHTIGSIFAALAKQLLGIDLFPATTAPQPPKAS